MKHSNHDLVGYMMMLNSLKRIAMASIPFETNVNWNQMPVLEYVGQHPGCSQVEIAETMLVSPASVALSTKRMQKAGLIEKQVDENNLRKKMLYITPGGMQAAQECRKMMDKIDEQMLEGFSEEEKEVLCGYLRRMISNFDSTVLDKPMDFISMRAMEMEAQQKLEEENAYD